MVPKEFDWRKYSQEHNLTNDRYWQIQDFCYRYKQMKSEYERLIFQPDPIFGGMFLDARTARQGYWDNTAEQALKSLRKENALNDRIQMIEGCVYATDRRLAPHILEMLTNKKYSRYTFEQFLDEKKLAFRPEYFERCWRYAICLLDANLKKRENHSTK